MEKWSGSEKSWERQPKESPQAYEAFKLYCELGDKRSLRKVEEELNKSHALIGRWSSAWNWKNRSRDYDNDLRRQEFAEAQRAQRKMQERQMQTAMLLQKKAVQALDKLQIEDLTPSEILRFISEGARLERETRAENTALSARDAGADGKESSLAETIIAAYERRKNGEGSND